MSSFRNQSARAFNSREAQPAFSKWLSLAAALLCPVLPAYGHRLPPEAVVERLRSAAEREHFGITSVEQSAELPRLLVIRVGLTWDALPPSERAGASERWLQAWRHVMDHGIVAIIDADSGASLVGFDAAGRATLRRRPTPPAPQ